MQENESCITLKDHKPEFPHKKTSRLINASKSDIRKIRKWNLDPINQRVLAATEVSHWKNTISTLEWFKNIDQKENCSFIKFDNENFYTLILIPLFNKAIEFAKETCFISNDISIIIQEAPWIKKTGNENFKLPMGCFGGTDICDLVGSYIFCQN